MLKGKLSGSLLVFLGAVCWSLNAPLVKFVQRDLDPFLVCGLRSLWPVLSSFRFLDRGG